MPAIDRIGLGSQMRKHVTFAADGVNDAAVFNVEPVNAAESTPGKGKLVGGESANLLDAGSNQRRIPRVKSWTWRG